jgi:hypothetical protein
MADYPISNVPRRIVYTGSAGVGPYAFDFEVLLNTDINVYKNDVLLTITTDYTVSISPTLGTGSVTLVSAAAGTDRITIVGARAVERTTDFTTGGDFFANSMNDELDSQTILVQQVAETAERSIKAPVTDPTNIDMTLPINTSRAGKTLAFDADGNPVPGDPIGNWRGDWASGVSYQNRDIIKDTTNSNVYLATVTHVSSGSLPITTNTDSAKWALVVDAAAAGDSATAAAASASAAATSATNAASSATSASSSAGSASTSATNAATSATNASNSATSASTSATNAGNSATAAAGSATSASASASSATTSATNAASSASAASTSASNAATSETNAATSASSASTSASTATTQAGIATTQASNASTSATAAQSAQTAAESARDATLAAYDQFDDRYLGAKTSDPTLDNDGNALVAGALYFNSVDGVMKLYTGTIWVAAYVSGDGFLASSSNLSDLTNADSALTNLGGTTVGKAVFKAASVSAAQQAIDLEVGVDVQAYDADLTTLGAGGADARSFLGLAIGTDVQAYDADIPTVSASQIEMETGTETALRSMSPLRVAQAISALAVSGGGFSNMEVFTSSGTFTVPAGITKVKVTVVGGGGNGGTALANSTRGQSGGGGGAAIEVISGLTAGGTVSVTVGGASGTSSFGTYCSATGGVSGSSSLSSYTNGGVGSGGNINLTGEKGAFGGASTGTFDNGGGSSALSFGFGGVAAQSNGFNGDLYGGGASGSLRATIGGPVGGTGAAGVVIVEY